MENLIEKQVAHMLKAQALKAFDHLMQHQPDLNHNGVGDLEEEKNNALAVIEECKGAFAKCDWVQLNAGIAAVVGGLRTIVKAVDTAELVAGLVSAKGKLEALVTLAFELLDYLHKQNAAGERK